MRSETKYFRLYEFGKSLPAIRQQLDKDVASQGLHLKKILATVVLLMERTSIRVGNSLYEKLYGSFGLTTLKNRHVNIKGSTIRFVFKGKKGGRLRIREIKEILMRQKTTILGAGTKTDNFK